MEIKLKDYDKKLHDVYNRRKTHRGSMHRPTSECYSIKDVQKAVKECAIRVFEDIGELPSEVFIVNRPTLNPWRVLKFKLLTSGIYSFKRFIIWRDFHGDAFLLVRKGDNLYENTYGTQLEILAKELNSSLLVDFLREIRLPVRKIYDLWGGYYLGNTAIMITNSRITLFGDENKTVSEIELLEHLTASQLGKVKDFDNSQFIHR